MADAHEIIPGVYLSNYQFASNYPLLKQLGITHILNCAGEMKAPPPSYFKYYSLNLNDVPTENIAKYFGPAKQFIDSALQNNGKIVIHCYAGISRSVTILVSYLMAKYRLSPDETIRRVQSIRRVANPNIGFRKQLDGYFNWLQTNTAVPMDVSA